MENTISWGKHSKKHLGGNTAKLKCTPSGMGHGYRYGFNLSEHQMGVNEVI